MSAPSFGPAWWDDYSPDQIQDQLADYRYQDICVVEAQMNQQVHSHQQVFDATCREQSAWQTQAKAGLRSLCEKRAAVRVLLHSRRAESATQAAFDVRGQLQSAAARLDAGDLDGARRLLAHALERLAAPTTNAATKDTPA